MNYNFSIVDYQKSEDENKAIQNWLNIETLS